MKSHTIPAVSGWAFEKCPRLRSIGIGVNEPGQSAPVTHSSVWALHLHRYHGSIEIDDQTFSLFPGCLSLIPPGTTHRKSYKDPGSVHIFAFMEIEPDESNTTALPLLHELGNEYSQASLFLEEAVARFPTDPLRASLRVWDVILGCLKRHATPDATLASDILVDRFVQWVEMHINDDIGIETITDAMGCSYVHLNNHVKHRLGYSVKRYMRRQRLARIISQMKYSDSSIKDLATTTGFRSLQAFNQFIQRECQTAPRTLQAQVRAGRRLMPDHADSPRLPQSESRHKRVT